MQKIIESLTNTRKMGEVTTGNRWLNAHEDRSANVKVFNGRCMLLSDYSNTGDYGLIIAEPKINVIDDQSSDENLPTSGCKVSVNGRLRVYKGTASLCSERPLAGPPSALLSFYSDELEPRIPAVAVSIGTDILIYKNNKPFYKWSTPCLPSTALENEIWRKLVSSEGPESLKESLSSLKSIPFNELSPRSQKLLILAADKKDGSRGLEEFIGRYIHSDPPVRPQIIVSMTTLNKNSPNIDSVACLVVATENGHIYVLDTVAFTVLHQASSTSQSNSSPTQICCSGQFDIDYRIIILCRDSSAWVLKRGWLEGRKLITATLGGPIIDCFMLGPENFIVIAGKAKIGVWSKKGKLLYNVQPMSKTPEITCICLISLPHLNTNLLAVGINTQIQLFQNRTIVDIINLPDIPTAIKFGQLGKEENVLIIVTKDGSLLFKILKRTADFSTNSNYGENFSNSSLVNKPLPLPKRSKLFSEQAQRERNNAVNIHQTFQQGLIRLRLIAAKNTVLVLNNKDVNISENAKHPLKISAQVLGLGPRFTLTLKLENLSSTEPLSNLSILLHSNIVKYKIERPYLSLPMVPPELSLKVETAVTEIIDSSGIEDNEIPTLIRVFVLIEDNVNPILAATINMPPTDPLAFLV